MNKDFAFGKSNFIWIGISIALIILGFILMSGGSSPDGISFNPELFSARRIKIAPAITMIGFMMMVYGILKGDKKAGKQDNEQITK